jgi:hypothetical protein
MGVPVLGEAVYSFEIRDEMHAQEGLPIFVTIGINKLYPFRYISFDVGQIPWF